jgi:hypothetical protein
MFTTALAGQSSKPSIRYVPNPALPRDCVLLQVMRVAQHPREMG